MYGNTLILIIGEAKKRKNLGIPSREKTEEIKLPKLDKKSIQKIVRSTLYIELSLFFFLSCNRYPNRRLNIYF